jgi:hypothetical protein
MMATVGWAASAATLLLSPGYGAARAGQSMAMPVTG